MKSFESELLSEALLSGAPSDEVANILSEDFMTTERRESQMEYVLLLEQLFDDCSVYAFDGWDEGIVLGPPHVSKFWVEADIAFPPNLDLDGAKRIIGKTKQNTIKIKKQETRVVLRFKILRSQLDAIEQNNRVEAKADAEDEGYRDEPQPAQQQPQQPAPGGDMGMGEAGFQ